MDELLKLLELLEEYGYKSIEAIREFKHDPDVARLDHMHATHDRLHEISNCVYGFVKPLHDNASPA